MRVTSGMTGPYGRLNHFGHPDAEVRRYYVDWFRTFADIAGDLGARSIGTQFAIFTYRDYDDPARRAALIDSALDCWGAVAEHARAAGLDYVFWEPMSVGREFGHTIRRLPGAAGADRARRSGAADVDDGRHRPRRRLLARSGRCRPPTPGPGAVPLKSPIIHVKQSSMDKGVATGRSPPSNKRGRPDPARDAAGGDPCGRRTPRTRSAWNCRSRSASRPTARLTPPAIAESGGVLGALGWKTGRDDLTWVRPAGDPGKAPRGVRGP